MPELPPPTVHEPWEHLPKNLISLVSPFGMVKGIRSLNLELSWVYAILTLSSCANLTLVLLSPFKYGSKVPTDEEVSRVSDGILDDLTISIGQSEDQVRRLLSDLLSRAPSELISDLVFVEHTHPEDFLVTEILSNESIRSHQLVLTREERHTISRIGADLSDQISPGPLQHLTGLTSAGDIPPVFDPGEFIFEELEFNSQVPQCDSAQSEHVQPEYYQAEDEREFGPAPAKKRRLGDFSPGVDPRLAPFPPSPDSPHHTIPLPVAVTTSPRQAELLGDGYFSQPLPAPQNSCVPLIATSQPRDLVQPDLFHTAHQPVQDDEPSLVPATGRRRDFDEFLALRCVYLDEPPAAIATEIAIDNLQPIEVPPIPQPAMTVVPIDLIDANTIRVPAADVFPVSRHQYLASLDLLQKHALCRCLSDDLAAIDLIEREFLGGVDLILDQDTAILFLPLSTLPPECEGLIAGISDISWRYSHILVIFEAFIISQAFSDCEENRLVPFPFTEPIIKSVTKLKRSLLIADGVGTKTEDCVVSWAFAKNIEEAARLARAYGDMAESRDRTGGLLWQERWWLGEKESEGSALFEFEVCPATSSQNHHRLIEHPGRK